MIRWIQDRIWLASAIISIPITAVLALADFFSAGLPVLISAALFGAGLLFAFISPQAQLAAQVFGLAAVVVFEQQGATSLLTFLTPMVAAALQARAWGVINSSVSAAILIFLLWFSPNLQVTVFEPFLVLGFGARLALSFLITGAVLASYLLGRYFFLVERHVGTEFDQALHFQNRARLTLEMAEQEERFDIAREITELVIQRNTAVISQAEGALYAAKIDAAVAPRALERVSNSARQAQAEIRRLYELLNRSKKISPAPPGLGELEELVISFRERGYNVTLRESGHQFRIPEGASFVIYKIIFDALDNVAAHCSSGTDVSIDFTWVDSGVQVMIKDNGFEVARRAAQALGLADSDETPTDQLDEIVEQIEGPTLTGMRERAAIYGGKVEISRSNQVGFNISAIFPSIRQVEGQ